MSSDVRASHVPCVSFVIVIVIIIIVVVVVAVARDVIVEQGAGRAVIVEQGAGRARKGNFVSSSITSNCSSSDSSWVCGKCAFFLPNRSSY